MADSYDQLAQSIERVIRSDFPPPTSSDELAGSIDRIMLEEARAGELRLAYLRVVVILPCAVLSWWTWGDGRSARMPLALVPPALLAVSWLALAVGLVVALRRGWYGRALPHLTPMVDAAMTLGVFLLAWQRRTGPSVPILPELLAYLTTLCAFLSLSGAMRLSRFSARLGIALAVAVFLTAALVSGVRLLSATAVVVALVATGMLGVSVTALVRRVVTDEVAKATLARMYEEAAETIDAREQVLKIVSHDLRNPLHTISMCAALMLEVPLSADQQGGHLKRIKRAGERMNRLIQDLLDVAKLESGRVGISARTMEVEPLLREAHDMLAPLAAEKSLSLDLQVAPTLPDITADAGRIIQVVSNLVGNAIKFTPAGGRIVLGADAAPRGVRFSVSDTGPGIPADQLDRLFGRFWQADAADRRGIGLGLTIAKGIVDAHGGQIWVESRVGEGTSFHFIIETVLPPTSSGARERRRTGSTPTALRA